MAAIYQVENGVTVWDEDDVNQYAQAFNAVLGITDTAQDELGRLVTPRGTSFPGTPSTGMQFFKTDEGLGTLGKMYVRHSGVWVPYVPLRQYIEGSEVIGNNTITSTSFADMTGLTLSITTTGGYLEIGVRPSNADDANGSLFLVNLTGAEFGAEADIRAVVGATNLGQINNQISGDASSTLWGLGIPVSSLRWIYRPAAGTYTVKLQAKVATSNGRLQWGATALASSGPALYVKEFG